MHLNSALISKILYNLIFFYNIYYIRIQHLFVLHQHYTDKVTNDKLNHHQIDKLAASLLAETMLAEGSKTCVYVKHRHHFFPLFQRHCSCIWPHADKQLFHCKCRYSLPVPFEKKLYLQNATGTNLFKHHSDAN